MDEVIERPPRTIMEVYKMLPEGTLAEIIDGIIYMSPSPLRKHQRIITQLVSQFFDFVEENKLGEVYVAPFDVYLDEAANAVQPDIVFVRKSNLSIIEDHIHGVPDLVIEVLSDGNRNHDLKVKKDLYERFGIQEYWVIDPETEETMGFIFSSGQYQALPNVKGKLSSPMLKKTFEY